MGFMDVLTDDRQRLLTMIVAMLCSSTKQS